MNYSKDLLMNKDLLIDGILFSIWTFITILIVNTSNVRATRWYIFGLLVIQLIIILIISKFTFSR
jgi:hypothetical protein